MNSRALLLLLAVCFASGCATMSDDFVDASPESAVASVVPTLTPEQIYDAGVLDMQRGDYDSARRRWEHCLQVTTPESPSRLDCMVALEKLTIASAPQR